MAQKKFLTGVERFFGENDLIVSKTDLKGKMTYCNKTFLDIASYKESDCLGEPHSMIRHPDMPRAIFKLLWSTIQQRREIFAYVVNRAANGDHYWVYAHVTPSIGESGSIIGYHSNRRIPDRRILDNFIIPLYRDLVEKEQSEGNRKQGLGESEAVINDLLSKRGVQYDEFIATLGRDFQH